MLLNHGDCTQTTLLKRPRFATRFATEGRWAGSRVRKFRRRLILSSRRMVRAPFIPPSHLYEKAREHGRGIVKAQMASNRFPGGSPQAADGNNQPLPSSSPPSPAHTRRRTPRPVAGAVLRTAASRSACDAVRPDARGAAIPVCEGMDTNPFRMRPRAQCNDRPALVRTERGACRDQRIEVRNRLLQSPFKGVGRLGRRLHPSFHRR